MEKNYLILSIESSCDETSVAIVKNGREVLSCSTNTQIAIHRQFGGVVPEVASRNHIKNIDVVCQDALSQANVSLDDIDAIAVTYGAGLLGALLVGVNFAKGLAYATGKPLIPVSHIKGHIASNYITYKDLKPPFLCLLVSGGHSALLNVKTYTQFDLIGSTTDDAVGEAFDKVARICGLPYPGGVHVDELAKQGEPNIEFAHKNILANTYNFSFSGIKTAVVNYVHNLQQKSENINVPNICASFQSFVTNELSSKTIKAAKEFGFDKVVVAGGVSANSYLKKELTEKCAQNGIKLYMPDLKYCTDNGAMIASAAYYEMLAGNITTNFLNLTAKANVPLK